MANILVVEDEEMLREMLADHLADEGHHPFEASNGREALEAYPFFKPDLIISDINMPIMDGYQFLAALQSKHPEVEDIPFFFLSALNNTEDQIKGLNFGIDEYLCKPIDLGVLSARIELSLSRRQKVNERIHEALEAPKPKTKPEIKSETKPETTPENKPENKPKPKQTAAPTKVETIPPSASGTSGKDRGFASMGSGLLTSKRLKLNAIQIKKIKAINEPVHFHSASLINSIGKKANISRLFIKKEKYESMINDISSSEFDESLFLQVIELFFGAVIYFLDNKKYMKERVVIIPCLFEYLSRKNLRYTYNKMIDYIQIKYSVSIIIEIVNTPNHLSEYEDVLKALSHREQPTILEITRTAQLIDVNLSALRIGAVSMNYNAAAELSKEEMIDLRQLLMNYNAEFYIKEITEGKLGNAQMFNADLLSVSLK